MEPRLLIAITILAVFVGYMLINLVSFWKYLEEIRQKNEKQDRLRGRYSGYSGLGGLTTLLVSKKRMRRPKRSM